MTTRPVEYSECRPMIQRVERQFGQLLRLAGKLPDHRYRFAVLYHFKEFEKAVWLLPSGQKMKLINAGITCSLVQSGTQLGA